MKPNFSAKSCDTKGLPIITNDHLVKTLCCIVYWCSKGKEAMTILVAGPVWSSGGGCAVMMRN